MGMEGDRLFSTMGGKRRKENVLRRESTFSCFSGSRIAPRAAAVLHSSWALVPERERETAPFVQRQQYKFRGYLSSFFPYLCFAGLADRKYRVARIPREMLAFIVRRYTLPHRDAVALSSVAYRGGGCIATKLKPFPVAAMAVALAAATGRVGRPP
jgi:hypothetical protein